MLISEEVTGGNRRYIYTISPLFQLERNGTTVSMTVAGSADGWYDRYAGYYLWDGDLEAGLGTQYDYMAQYYDRPLDIFLQEELTPGEMISGYFIMNYGQFDVSFGVVIFDEAANFAGTDGRDFVFGSAFADTLSGGLGDDGFEGGGGDDIINGGPGADLIDGGDGSDTASYAGATAGVTANLRKSALNAGEAAGDRYLSIENLTGSRHGDFLHGDSQNNRLAGNDGDDMLSGWSGHDVLVGARGDDQLYGGAGNDTLTGGPGADLLDGGGGNDTASYAAARHGVTVDLASGQGTAGDATGDTLFSIENLTGSAFDDHLLGDGSVNRIRGGDGNDVIAGRGGADQLSGGRGEDTFVFGELPSEPGDVPVIGDYRVRDDIIHLDDAVFTALDSGLLLPAAFATGSAATDAAHRIIYNPVTGEISYDEDGVGGVAAIVFARVSAGLAMAAGEFFVF